MKINRFLLIVFGLFFTIANAQDAKEIEKQKSKLELFEEEKLTGDFATLHKKYAGKVVFSNSEITRESPEKNFMTTYTLGDKLHIRAFLSHSILNSMLLQMVEKGEKAKDINAIKSWNPKYVIVLYLDGNKVTNTRGDDVQFSQQETNTDLSQRATLNDSENDLSFGSKLYKDLKTKINLLTQGKHKLKIEYLPIFYRGAGDNISFNPIASGEIELVIKDKKMDLNDPDICMPLAKTNDKNIEIKILQAFKDFKDLNGKGLKAEPKKVRITSNKWNISRNEFGIITRRYVEAYVGYMKNGKCYYDVYNFNQDYDGSNYQDEIYFRLGPVGTEREISCECLK